MALGLTPQQIIDKGTHPLLEISNDWERIELNNIATVQNGYAFSSKLFNHSEGLPLIRIRDIFSEVTENLYSGEYKDEFLVNNGDILIGMDGDFKVSKWPGKKGLLNQRVCRIHFNSEYYNKQFLYLCVQPYLDAIHSETSAVTVKHLSSRTISSIPFPLPPLPEQQAIVNKIEELFSSLDSGIADLKRAQDQLKIYRQAVLKKAFEGELTKEWRKLQMVKYEWENVHLDEVLIQSKEKHKPEKIENLFYVGLEHIEKETGNLTENVGEEEIKTVKNKFISGQILYGKLRPYLNKVHLAKKEGVCSTDILVFTPSEKIYGKYALLFMLSRQFVNDMSNNTNGVNLPRVSTKYVNEYKVPLPSLKEQHQIVQEIESRLSVCDALEQSITDSLDKAQALRQSILKKAFEGKLLSEEEIAKCKADKDYEPASVLLEKMKTEKKKK